MEFFTLSCVTIRPGRRNIAMFDRIFQWNLERRRCLLHINIDIYLPTVRLHLSESCYGTEAQRTMLSMMIMDLGVASGCHHTQFQEQLTQDNIIMTRLFTELFGRLATWQRQTVAQGLTLQLIADTPTYWQLMAEKIAKLRPSLTHGIEGPPRTSEFREVPVPAAKMEYTLQLARRNFDTLLQFNFQRSPFEQQGLASVSIIRCLFFRKNTTRTLSPYTLYHIMATTNVEMVSCDGLQPYQVAVYRDSKMLQVGWSASTGTVIEMNREWTLDLNRPTAMEPDGPVWISAAKSMIDFVDGCRSTTWF
ncbi:hypothetical protein IF1G_01598 [Cordyceps javanica]|uniref:Uncharacterized protein n=1 Tax=Cordyceps javanica TaxID=43265 RepID=A0A545VCE7_9HYPO|nr:hypothetical protein IF1G_01598 [Cordyceps javanica]TQW10938.1 hypothetical protein IF2G_01880 [Cordyceps javanica]